MSFCTALADAIGGAIVKLVLVVAAITAVVAGLIWAIWG